MDLPGGRRRFVIGDLVLGYGKLPAISAVCDGPSPGFTVMITVELT